MTEITRWELINPSDPYSFTAPTFELAALATIFIGQGACPAIELDQEFCRAEEGQRIPLLLYGHEEFWQENFGRTLEESIEANRAELPAVLRTLYLAVGAGRLELEVLIAGLDEAEKEQALADWHETRRSSMWDIRAQVLGQADALEDAGQ